MLSLRDAVTNQMMRDIAELAHHSSRVGSVSVENRQQLDDGLVSVGGQITPAADALAREVWLDRLPIEQGDRKWRDGLNELEENEFFMWTETPFVDPEWRVEIFNQGMLIVSELSAQLRAIAPYPAQIILSINSGFDEDPDKGSDSTSGVVKFFLLRPDEDLDQSVGIDGYENPAAVFTLPASAG